MLAAIQGSAGSTTIWGRDIALVRQTAGGPTISVAFANGDGTCNITNGPAEPFVGQRRSRLAVRTGPWPGGAA
jgi:hypothetical protein